MSTFSYSVYDERAREMVADPEKYRAKSRKESLEQARKARDARARRVAIRAEFARGK